MCNRIKYINGSYRHNMSEQYERNVHKCAFFFFFFCNWRGTHFKASIKPLFGPLQICDQFEMIENMHSFHLVYYKI